MDGVLLLLPDWVSVFELEFGLFRDMFKFRSSRMSASFNILLISHHVHSPHQLVQGPTHQLGERFGGQRQGSRGEGRGETEEGRRGESGEVKAEGGEQQVYHLLQRC